MGKTIKQFGYKLIKRQQTNAMPFSPIVILNLDHWSGDEDDAPQISPHLMHEDEIDNYIVALKDDLDAVGKRALKKAKETTLEIAATRNSN